MSEKQKQKQEQEQMEQTEKRERHAAAEQREREHARANAGADADASANAGASAVANTDAQAKAKASADASADASARADATEYAHDIVVVSDLHIGRGKNARTRRYFALETFFWDADFAAFCRWLVRRASDRARPFKLIINGDAFDFLRIHEVGIDGDSTRHRRFSSELTPESAAKLVAEILAGHDAFVDALVLVVRSGNDVVFLPGNHDLELHWSSVQRAVREAVYARLKKSNVEDASTEAAAGAESALARLTFRPWFYFEPGRVWIEHGCQYDPENAFRYPLRGRLADDPGFTPEGEVDMPLGNFFQRYLYNAFGSITFIVPSSRANARYFKWLLLNEPRLLLRVATSHIPFAVQVLRRLAGSGGPLREQYKREHTASVAALAADAGLGERLTRIDALKQGGADAVRAAESILRAAASFVVRAAALVFLFAAAWVTAGQAIDSLALGFGLKAVLSMALNMVVLVSAVGLLTYRALRMPHDSHAPRPLKRAAEEIAKLADVPLVAFGHTHEEVVFALDARTSAGTPAWYVNSGTWIAVFTHDVLLPRERVQFSFIDIEGANGTLMQWSPARDDALPVVLLDEPGGASSSGAQPAA